MPEVVSFTAPHQVALVACEEQPLTPGSVRVRTWYSGISAGTELTAYRGSNPYLTGTWDPDRRLFIEGEPTFGYPVEGWGYSEVGEVVEVADGVMSPAVGDVVHGIWGHRSEAVVPAADVAHRVWTADDAISGTFARVGSIALNAVLAADTRLGDRLAVFGQGVIGLLATRLATLAGADVVAVDMLPRRLEAARAMGAVETVAADAEGGAGAVVREWSGGGVDAAIELSGSDRALHEAVRSVVVDGTVVASGFYQGGAANLRLGEEFHHNRVRIVASQISGTPVGLGPRWDQPRLVRTFMELVRRGQVDAASLVTDVVDAADVAAVFERLDRGDPDILQAVLRFPAAPRERRDRDPRHRTALPRRPGGRGDPRLRHDRAVGPPAGVRAARRRRHRRLEPVGGDDRDRARAVPVRRPRLRERRGAARRPGGPVRRPGHRPRGPAGVDRGRRRRGQARARPEAADPLRRRPGPAAGRAGEGRRAPASGWR